MNATPKALVRKADEPISHESADALEAEAHEKIAEGHALLARARRLRAVPNADEYIPLQQAAERIGATPRMLRDAAARGELVIEGPKLARVVRRSSFERWLASHRLQPTTPSRNADERADARGSVVRAAARFAKRTA
jgi:hypothetical protein